MKTILVAILVSGILVGVQAINCRQCGEYTNDYEGDNANINSILTRLSASLDMASCSDVTSATACAENLDSCALTTVSYTIDAGVMSIALTKSAYSCYTTLLEDSYLCDQSDSSVFGPNYKCNTETCTSDGCNSIMTPGGNGADGNGESGIDEAEKGSGIQAISCYECGDYTYHTSNSQLRNKVEDLLSSISAGTGKPSCSVTSPSVCDEEFDSCATTTLSYKISSGGNSVVVKSVETSCYTTQLKDTAVCDHLDETYAPMISIIKDYKCNTESCPADGCNAIHVEGSSTGLSVSFLLIFTATFSMF